MKIANLRYQDQYSLINPARLTQIPLNLKEGAQLKTFLNPRQ